jgi:hypothetical protein
MMGCCSKHKYRGANTHGQAYPKSFADLQVINAVAIPEASFIGRWELLHCNCLLLLLLLL